MKNSWLLQERRAEQKARHDDAAPSLVKPRQVWLLRGAETLEATILLKNGDILVTYSDDNRVYRVSQYGPKFRRLRDLRDDDIPHNAANWVLQVGTAVLTHNYEPSSGVQILQTHDVESGVEGENSLEFRGSLLRSVTRVITEDDSALIVLGDENGGLHLICYRDGVMTKVKRIRGIHRASIERIDWSGNRFWAVSLDGVVTVWNANTKRLIGVIRSPCIVDVAMTRDYLFLIANDTVRVYENNYGLKFRWAMKLPIVLSKTCSYAYIMLTNSVGLLHDGYGQITFYNLIDGNVISRVNSPFKSVRSLWILADATLMLTSDIVEEGLAIVSVEKPDVIYEALREYAREKYPDAVFNKSDMAGGIKWAKWMCIVSAAISALNLVKRLVMKRGAIN